MNYAAVLAGGVGSRVKGIDVPKQFAVINGRPIISYTIESILKPGLFDKVYIAVHKDWIEYTQNLVRSQFSDCSGIFHIVCGGKERMGSINNVISSIRSECTVSIDDIIVIHDAARPFVTEMILIDSVKAAAEYGAVVTALSASDTMLISKTGEEVDTIPKREAIFHGQAPDSFRLKLFLNMMDSLTDEQRKTITGTSQICTLNGHKLHMIKGDALNFKITTDFDLFVAGQLAEKLKENQTYG